MKKFFKSALASVTAGAMAVAGMGVLPAATAMAEEESYALFIAYGGDAEASNDWAYSFASDTQEGATTIKVGETATTTLTLPAECLYTWYMAPVIVAENVKDMDVEVSVKIDGVETEIDATAGDAWWYEGTGDFGSDQAIRLYGGYNEWGTHYIESPVFTTIEYTVTLNSIELAAAGAGVEAVDYTGDFSAYIGFGADAAESNDWGIMFNSADDVTGDITQEVVTGKVGDTFNLKATVAAPVLYTWWLAPVFVPATDDSFVALDFDIELKIDGEPVDIDMSAGDAWWAEGTGSNSNALRLAGGYNEWGTHYIESPVFTEIEYTITVNSAATGEPVVEEVELAELNYDIIETFPAQISNFGRGDQFYPDAVYTVQNDVQYVTLNIAYASAGEEAGGFNDWCANGIVVTLNDGTKKYYAFGGAQATWDISIESPDAGEVAGGANNADNQFFTLAADGTGEIKLLVDGAGATIAIYALGWEDYDGVVYTVDVVEGDGTVATEAPAPAEPVAAETAKAGFPVWAIVLCSVCGVGVVGAVVAVVLNKKKSAK